MAGGWFVVGASTMHVFGRMLCAAARSEELPSNSAIACQRANLQSRPSRDKFCVSQIANLEDRLQVENMLRGLV